MVIANFRLINTSTEACQTSLLWILKSNLRNSGILIPRPDQAIPNTRKQRTVRAARTFPLNIHAELRLNFLKHFISINRLRERFLSAAVSRIGVLREWREELVCGFHSSPGSRCIAKLPWHHRHHPPPLQLLLLRRPLGKPVILQPITHKILIMIYAFGARYAFFNSGALWRPAWTLSYPL